MTYGPDFWTKTLEKLQNLRIDDKIRSLWANRKSEFKLLLFLQVSSFTEIGSLSVRSSSGIDRIRQLSPESRSRKCHGGNDLLKISKWNIIEEAMREIGVQNSIKTFSGIHWPPTFDRKLWTVRASFLRQVVLVSEFQAFEIFDRRNFRNFWFFICFIVHMHVERHYMFRFQMALK